MAHKCKWRDTQVQCQKHPPHRLTPILCPAFTENSGHCNRKYGQNRRQRKCTHGDKPLWFGLPRHRGGSASALKLSRPARASPYYGPSDRSAAQGDPYHEAPIQPVTRPNRSARQLPASSTTIRVEPSSTGTTHSQGAHGDTCIFPVANDQRRQSPEPASPDT